MKKRIRLKGRIRTYIQFTLYLGLLLLAIDAAVFPYIWATWLWNMFDFAVQDCLPSDLRFFILQLP
mgnify:CR=1 FL=1